MTYKDFEKEAKKLGYERYSKYDVYTGQVMLYGMVDKHNTFDQNGSVVLENVPYDKMLKIMEILK